MLLTEEITKKLKVNNPNSITIEQVLDLVENVLAKELPLLAYPGKTPVEIMPMLDYSLAGFNIRDNKFISLHPEDAEFYALAVTGGSEGVYTDVYAKVWDWSETESRHVTQNARIFTFKTLEDGPSAYAAMGVIAGMVPYLLDVFTFVNY